MYSAKTSFAAMTLLSGMASALLKTLTLHHLGANATASTSDGFNGVTQSTFHSLSNHGCETILIFKRLAWRQSPEAVSYQMPSVTPPRARQPAQREAELPLS